jgi:cytochrome P450
MSDKNLNKPPGPGLWDLLRRLPALRNDPPKFLYQSFMENGDVVAFDVPGNLAYFINHPDDVQHVLQMNHRNYSKDTFQYNVLARITGQGLLTNDSEDWLVKRRIAQPAFSPKSLQGIIPVVIQAVESMLSRWESVLDGGQLLDIDREMMQCALEVVAQSLFGADLSDRAYRLTGAVMDALDYLIFQTRTLMMVPSWLPIRQNRAYREAMGTIESVVNALIDRRSQEDPGDDFLGMLLGAKDNTGIPALSRKEIRDEVVTLLIAGHETVASSLTWSWYLLAQHAEARQKLHREACEVLGRGKPSDEILSALSFTEQVYEEALRLYPPAWLITRKALGEDRIGEYTVPPGTLIIISPYTMHRRADFWPSPEVFDPARFDREGDTNIKRHRFSFIPFGGGPRLCIGNRFAYIEAKLILAMVARKVVLRLPPGQSVPVEALVTLRPGGGLPMRVEPVSHPPVE